MKTNNVRLRRGGVYYEVGMYDEKIKAELVLLCDNINLFHLDSKCTLC